MLQLTLDLSLPVCQYAICGMDRESPRQYAFRDCILIQAAISLGSCASALDI